MMYENYQMSDEEKEYAKEHGISANIGDGKKGSWDSITKTLIDLGGDEQNVKKQVSQMEKMWNGRPKKGDKKYNPKDIPAHHPLYQLGDFQRLIKRAGEAGVSLKNIIQYVFFGKFAIQVRMYAVETEGEQERRVGGAQVEEEIEHDKQFLADYQAKLKEQRGGEKFINNFRQGNFGILHSISYSSWGSRAGASSEERDDDQKISVTPFTSWFKKFGKMNRNTLSTVAVNNSVEDGFGKLSSSENRSVSQGMGFVMKGYPVMVSETDVMSQNLGVISKKLIKFHAGSGSVKRASSNIAKPIYPDKGWEYASEVLLDNWNINGTYISHVLIKDKKIKKDKLIAMIKDGIKLGLSDEARGVDKKTKKPKRGALPVYLFGSSGVIKIESENDIENAIKKMSLNESKRYGKYDLRRYLL